MITITERQFAELLIRNRDFGAISEEYATKLKDFAEVHVEREGDIYYIYWASVWRASQERRDKRAAIYDALRIRVTRRREAKAKLVTGIQKITGLPSEQCVGMVDKMADNKSNEMIARSFNTLDEDEVIALFDKEADKLWINSSALLNETNSSR